MRSSALGGRDRGAVCAKGAGASKGRVPYELEKESGNGEREREVGEFRESRCAGKTRAGNRALSRVAESSLSVGASHGGTLSLGVTQGAVAKRSTQFAVKYRTL